MGGKEGKGTQSHKYVTFQQYRIMGRRPRWTHFLKKLTWL